jgi:hypothetical protein
MCRAPTSSRCREATMASKSTREEIRAGVLKEQYGFHATNDEVTLSEICKQFDALKARVARVEVDEAPVDPRGGRQCVWDCAECARLKKVAEAKQALPENTYAELVATYGRDVALMQRVDAVRFLCGQIDRLKAQVAQQQAEINHLKIKAGVPL